MPRERPASARPPPARPPAPKPARPPSARPQRAGAPPSARPYAARRRPAPASVRDAAPTPGVPVAVRTVDVEGRTWTLRQEGAKEMGRGCGAARILGIRVVGPDGAPDGGTVRYLAAAGLGEATEDQLATLVREATSANRR